MRDPIVAAALAALVLATLGRAAEPQVLPLEGDLEGVHDPVIVKQGDTYYVFSTNGRPGALIPSRCSQDLRRWSLCGHVFDQLPEWARQEIPGARAPWAPDISYFNGTYHLYYSVSTFGKNESAIGPPSTTTCRSRSRCTNSERQGMKPWPRVQLHVPGSRRQVKSRTMHTAEGRN